MMPARDIVWSTWLDDLDSILARKSDVAHSNITFLGIQINTVVDTLSLVKEKPQNIQHQLLAFSTRKRASAANASFKALQGFLVGLARVSAEADISCGTSWTQSSLCSSSITNPSRVFEKDVKLWLSCLHDYCSVLQKSVMFMLMRAAKHAVPFVTGTEPKIED